MSNVPQAIRKQIKEAARMQAAVQSGQDPFQGKGPAPPTPPPQSSAQIQPVPNFAVVGDEIPPGFKPVDLTRGDPAAQPQPAHQPTQVAQPAVSPPTNPSSRWTPASQANNPPTQQGQPVAQPPQGAQPVASQSDHRYSVLQGKYNSETRELRGQVQDLIAQNRAMTAILAQRNAAPAAPAPTAVPKTQRDRALAAGFTDKEIEEFGEDVVAMMVRTAENISAPQIAALRQENARLAGAMQNTTATITRNAEERFWDGLSELVPEWAEINQSQEWLDWLQQIDIISGQPRNAGLQNAFAEFNARRVAAIMGAFKAEDARTRSTVGQSHIDPSTLIAPGQPHGGTPAPTGSSDADVRIWTEEEVRQFYSNVRRGRLKGAEKARIEAELNKALAQGRIRPEHNDANLANAR